MLTIAKFDRYDTVNNVGEPKPSFTIWFSGCTLHCPGCHNKELWEFNNGEMMDTSQVYHVVADECIKLGIETVVLLGGEPLDQHWPELLALCSTLHNNGLKIWLYTGYDFNDIPVVIRNYVDIAKCGRYIESLKCEGFLASANQELWHKINNKWSIMDRWFD
jgi:anaerobic ribonucleoside-triphosphate reductase activating protein